LRTVIFFSGIALMAIGPLVSLLAVSSCFGTILSGHFLACVTDFGFVAFGGVLLIIGLITAVVGAVVQEVPPSPLYGPYRPPATPQPAEINCKKCGTVYGVDRFFCPSCGQRR
jgi:hypothetical protein